MSRRHRDAPTPDRISALPDEILCHILSFLPTKTAVATTVLLSKRWTPLWLSLPTLYFDVDQTFLDGPLFNQFVTSVLRRYSNNSLVRTFRLRFTASSVRRRHFDDWIHAAAQRGLQILDLCLPCRCFYSRMKPFRLLKLPRTVPTLVALNLKDLALDSLPHADFPLLKTLRLDGVSFDTHASLMRLLAGCPLLEDFKATSLRVVEDFRDGEAEAEAKSLPQFLQRFFNSGGVPTFHNLTCLEVSYNPWHWGKLVQLLHHSPKLQNLFIHTEHNKREDYEDDWEGLVPECLSRLRTCSIRNYGGMECELRFARYIMQNSRVLWTMGVTASFPANEDFDVSRKLYLCPRISPMCKLSFK